MDYSETVIRQAQQLHQEKTLAGILRREKATPSSDQRHHVVASSSYEAERHLEKTLRLPSEQLLRDMKLSPPSSEQLLRDMKLSPPSSEKLCQVVASSSDQVEQMQHLVEPLGPTHGLHFQVCLCEKGGGKG